MDARRSRSPTGGAAMVCGGPAHGGHVCKAGVLRDQSGRLCSTGSTGVVQRVFHAVATHPSGSALAHGPELFFFFFFLRNTEQEDQYTEVASTPRPDPGPVRAPPAAWLVPRSHVQVLAVQPPQLRRRAHAQGARTTGARRRRPPGARGDSGTERWFGHPCFASWCLPLVFLLVRVSTRPRHPLSPGVAPTRPRTVPAARTAQVAGGWTGRGGRARPLHVGVRQRAEMWNGSAAAAASAAAAGWQQTARSKKKE